MSNKEILEYVKLIRPRAKFVKVIHADDMFKDIEGNDIIKYHYVNLYDENISANAIYLDKEPIILHNTYISSFAYNLNVSYLYALTKFKLYVQVFNKKK